MIDDLITWLRAQLDDDERVARAAVLKPGHTGGWEVTGMDADAIQTVDADDWAMVVYDEGAPTPGQAAHIARWDPKRVLAEIDAKRRIIGMHEGRHWCSPGPEDTEWRVIEAGEEVTRVYPCLHLRVLALPYADRPRYREEWRSVG